MGATVLLFILFCMDFGLGEICQIQELYPLVNLRSSFQKLAFYPLMETIFSPLQFQAASRFSSIQTSKIWIWKWSALPNLIMKRFISKQFFFWFECIWIAIQEDDWYRGIPFENLTFLQLAAWPFIRQQLNPSAAKIAWSYFYSDVIHDIQVGNPTSDETFHFTNYFWSPLYLSYDRFSDSDFAIWIWFLKEAGRFSRGPWTIQMKRSPGKRHPVWTDLDLEKPNSGLYRWSASFQFRSGHLNLSSHLIWTGVPILTSSINVVSFTIRSLGEQIGKELCSLFSMNRPVFQISRNPHPSACWMVPDGTYSVCCSENKTERKIAEFYFSCSCCFWLSYWFVIRFRQKCWRPASRQGLRFSRAEEEFFSQK